MGIDVLAVIGDAAEVMGRDGYTVIPNDLIAAGELIHELMTRAHALGPLITEAVSASRGPMREDAIRRRDAFYEALIAVQPALSTLSEAR